MKNSKLKFMGAVIVLAAIFISGCGGPQVKNLYTDESFNGARVRSGHLYVGGVAYAAGDIENRDNIETDLTDQLWTEMAENIKDCYMAPENRLTSKMEESAYQAIMGSYGKKGELDKDIRLWLKDTFGDEPACIAFARVEQDYTENYESKVKDSTDKWIATDFCASRKMKIRMEVYDVGQEKIVWSGYFRHSEKAANRYDEIFGDDNLIEIIADAIIDEEKDREFPSPPGWIWVADDIFKSFAKSLPEK